MGWISLISNVLRNDMKRKPHVIDETEVELCLEVARQYDQEDLTHPPHRLHDEDRAIIHRQPGTETKGVLHQEGESLRRQDEQEG